MVQKKRKHFIEYIVLENFSHSLNTIYVYHIHIYLKMYFFSHRHMELITLLEI